MTRRSDWEQRLAEYLMAAEKKPYAYGSHDCMIFAAGAVQALTGHDPAKGHRGKYKTAASSARYLKSLGFSSPAEMVSAELTQKEVGFAQRGDIVIDEEGIPGVVIGGQAVFVGKGEEGQAGFVRVGRSGWVKAYHVG